MKERRINEKERKKKKGLLSYGHGIFNFTSLRRRRPRRVGRKKSSATQMMR